METLKVQAGGSHYKERAIQPIEYTLKNELGFCEGNIIKYVSRHSYKNGAEDLKKAIHYLQILLEHTYGEQDDRPRKD